MSARHVKGILFADYIRMVRRRKDIDWARHLRAEDFDYLGIRIEPAGWYPMATFERLGDAILAEVGGGDVETVRLWGRFSVEPLAEAHPMLVAENDPMESLMRFHVLRSTFFDFPAVQIVLLTTDQADIAIQYFMGSLAEEAAAFQAMGFFEGLLALAGATEVEARFTERSWEGDERTLLSITFRSPGA